MANDRREPVVVQKKNNAVREKGANTDDVQHPVALFLCAASPNPARGWWCGHGIRFESTIQPPSFSFSEFHADTLSHFGLACNTQIRVR